MKTTLHLCPLNRGPFSNMPARDVQLDDDAILCNDVHLPWEHHMSGGPKLYVIGHEFGSLCAVWADHEQDALDDAVDANLLDCLLVSAEDQASASPEEFESWSYLGNASELFNLDTAWMQVVGFDYLRDIQLLCRFAEARGSGARTLDN